MRRAWPFALVLVVLAVRWWPVLASPGELADDDGLFRSFELVARGHSPYEYARYVYPPTLAWLGAKGLALVGHRGLLLLLRLANVAGVAIVAWLSFARVRERPLLRAACAAAVGALAAPLVAPLEVANPSGTVAGLALAGLAMWPTAPIAAGVLLGLSLAIKPIVLAGLPALAIHRSKAGRPSRVVAIAAAVAAALILPFARELGPMLARRQDLDPMRSGASVSVQHVLDALGLPVPAWPIFAAAVVLGCVLARRREWEPPEIGFLVAAIAVLALPRVWQHTLALVMPAGCAAAMATRWRDRAQVAHGLLVVCAALAVQQAEWWGSLVGVPSWVVGLGAAVPIAGYLALTAWAMRPVSLD